VSLNTKFIIVGISNHLGPEFMTFAVICGFFFSSLYPAPPPKSALILGSFTVLGSDRGEKGAYSELVRMQETGWMARRELTSWDDQKRDTLSVTTRYSR
jgi:hypothetical protein